MMQNVANIYYISTRAPLLWAVLTNVQNGPDLYCIKCYFLLAEARKKQKMFPHTRLGAWLWIGCNQVVQEVSTCCVADGCSISQQCVRSPLFKFLECLYFLDFIPSVVFHKCMRVLKLKLQVKMKRVMKKILLPCYVQIIPSKLFMTVPEEAGQLSHENLDQWNRAIFPRFFAFKFALDTEALKKYI